MRKIGFENLSPARGKHVSMTSQKLMFRPSNVWFSLVKGDIKPDKTLRYKSEETRKIVHA
jgi:hypothetical protein